MTGRAGGARPGSIPEQLVEHPLHGAAEGVGSLFRRVRGLRVPRGSVVGAQVADTAQNHLAVPGAGIGGVTEKRRRVRADASI